MPTQLAGTRVKAVKQSIAIIASSLYSTYKTECLRSMTFISIGLLTAPNYTVNLHAQEKQVM